MKPNLSIIIPAYNCSRTLEEAVASCLDQGLNENQIDFEVVIVNDASTDATERVMKKLAAAHPEIKIFFHDTNRGGGATRNTAIANASGDVIFCLDSDDILPKGTLAKMHAFMSEKTLSGVRCDAVGVHRSIKFKGRFRGADNAVRTDVFGYASERIPFESLLQKNGVLCPLYSVFMHTKESWSVAGRYPEDHGFDTQAFAWRFLGNGLVAYTCPDSEYFHRLHSRGLYASYYTREARAGKTNRNWFLIFTEFFYLFSPEAKRYILAFDLNSDESLFEALAQRFEPVFAKGYESLIRPHGKGYAAQLYAVAEVDAINKKLEEPIRSISFFKRIKRKIKKMLRRPRAYLFEIKTRLHARHPLSLIFHYKMLLIRQMCKVDFAENCSAEKAGEENAEKIDIIIPTISKDRALLEVMIESLKKNLCDSIGAIYIVSRPDENLISFCREKGFIFVDEKSVLGYGKEYIKYAVNGVDRSGWLFQQLLKLSGEKIVKTRRYLIVDSDTVLIHPHAFLGGEHRDKVVFRQNTEWHEPYFRAFQILFGYEAPTRLSFTSHMMLFDTEYLAAMKKEIEQKKGKAWDQAYIALANPIEASAMGDYDMYANWVLRNHPDKVIMKPLYNAGLPRKDFDTLANLTRKYGAKYKTLSFHDWIR